MDGLARSYIAKAQARLRVLGILLDAGDYSDVVREAQEAVELALKALLRAHGVEPLKFHDVSLQLEENKGRFGDEATQELPRLKAISQWLRREREFSFYGDIDLIPSEQYSVDDARRAQDDAQFVVEIVARGVGGQ